MERTSSMDFEAINEVFIRIRIFNVSEMDRNAGTA